MFTYIDDSSALSAKKDELKPSFGFPCVFAVCISILTYLTFRQTGEQSTCIILGVIGGFIVMTLYFVAEKERHLLTSEDDPCIYSQPKSKSILVPNFGLWIKLQTIFFLTASIAFLSLTFFGDPLFKIYLGLLNL